MKQDYAAEVAALDAEVEGLATQIEALRVRYQLRCFDLRELQEEAGDAEAWKAASKAQRAAVVALPADVLAALKSDVWQRGGRVRDQLVDLRLVRKLDGRYQLTALGRAARACVRRGAEWCGMGAGLFGGVS